MDKPTLYLVPTPIGNLKDITVRAIEVLGLVDLIVCEDTRHTRKLIGHYGIKRPLISAERFSEAKKVSYILGQLEEGKNIALVSDAGTPTISDPGSRLVSAVRAKGFYIQALPGACACITALSASGFEAPFRFIGFFPRRKAQREEELLRIKTSTDVTICYESPKRLVSLLGEMEIYFPEREVFVARELTKIHEEYLSGTPRDLMAVLEGRQIKGEITIIVQGGRGMDGLDHDTMENRARSLLESGHSRRDILRVLSQETGIGRNEIYKMLIALKKD